MGENRSDVWNGLPQAVTPNLIVIGAQKSASTFVQELLGCHPDIYVVPGEVPFFEEEAFATSDLDRLYTLFSSPRARAAKFRVIKRPNYLASPVVPHRVQSVVPDARLIAVLREPVARALSAYFHYMRDGFVPVMSVNDGFMDLLSRGEIQGYPRSREILEFGRYATHLARYFDHIERGRILILRHQDVLKHPQMVVARLAAFLELPTFSGIEVPSSRPQEVVYDIRRVKVLRAANRFRYTYSSDGMRLKRKQKSIIDFMALAAIIGVDRVLRSYMIADERLNLSSQINRDIERWYEEEMKALEDLTGVTFA